MFLRFSKGRYRADGDPYLKGVCFHGTMCYEVGKDIVGVGKVIKETERSITWNICLANDNALYDVDTLKRRVKNMIGSYYRWTDKGNKKRRIYLVDEYPGEELSGISAEITFKK